MNQSVMPKLTVQKTSKVVAQYSQTQETVAQVNVCKSTLFRTDREMDGQTVLYYVHIKTGQNDHFFKQKNVSF